MHLQNFAKRVCFSGRVKDPWLIFSLKMTLQETQESGPNPSRLPSATDHRIPSPPRCFIFFCDCPCHPFLQDSISAESQSSSMSMEELYQDLTPDEEGVSLLPESPESKAVVVEEVEEGFNVNLLGTVLEEEEEEMEGSGSLGLGISPLQSLSFLNAPILASSAAPILPSALPNRPPMLRRAVSMKVRFPGRGFLTRTSSRSPSGLVLWTSWGSRDPLHPTMVRRGRSVELKVGYSSAVVAVFLGKCSTL